jgi:hypothetical protein
MKTEQAKYCDGARAASCRRKGLDQAEYGDAIRTPSVKDLHRAVKSP